MSRIEDADAAWMELEGRLQSEFNIAVYTRSVLHEAPAVDYWDKPNFWGASPQPGEVAIIMGVDMSKDDPRATQIPVKVSHGASADIPVVYRTTRQMARLDRS